MAACASAALSRVKGKAWAAGVADETLSVWLVVGAGVSVETLRVWLEVGAGVADETLRVWLVVAAGVSVETLRVWFSVGAVVAVETPEAGLSALQANVASSSRLTAIATRGRMAEW